MMTLCDSTLEQRDGKIVAMLASNIFRIDASPPTLRNNEMHILGNDGRPLAFFSATTFDNNQAATACIALQIMTCVAVCAS